VSTGVGFSSPSGNRLMPSSVHASPRQNPSPCVSTVSVDVISAVLAARLKNLEGGSGLDGTPEECIRRELMLMQEQGIILSPQDPNKDKTF
jgi:hypothetical protein